MLQQDIENLPIDIHYNKLVDWLINRRHCNQQWQPSAMVIREKINAAIQDMPEVKEISKLLEGTYINYFHCLKIVKLLKETDSGKKNVFGMYSSQKMKDWLEIIKLYEKDGVLLGETAQMLVRNVNYEITALKKQIAKCQQIQQECTRKESDYANNAISLKKKYAASCKQMGIKGEKIKSELAALVRDLPAEFDKMAKKAQNLENVTSYYENFISFVMDRADLGKKNVPVLRFVMKNGNKTVYEWRKGKKPISVEETKIVIDTGDEEDIVENPDEIDWGDPGAGSAEDAIDFGDDANFDISEITIESGGDETRHEGGTADSGTTEADAKEDAKTDVIEDDGVARGDDALTILDNPESRTQFTDDLSELEAFLIQRLAELKVDDSGVVGNQIQSAPVSIQLDEQTLEDMLSQVTAILNDLMSVQMKHLLLIRDSPRYVDRLRDTLKQTLTLADKMVFYEKEMVVKRKEALAEQAELEPALDVLIKKTKIMQKQMEGEISKKYKNRPVNIMGEINMI